MFRPREQYIGQLEALGAVLAYSSRPEQFADRDVIHFIDNVGALVGIAKGYSRDIDSARLIHFFHSIAAAVNTNVWFEFVASGANIADLPSRDELEKLHELGSVAFQPRWPDLGACVHRGPVASSRLTRRLRLSRRDLQSSMDLKCRRRLIDWSRS